LEFSSASTTRSRIVSRRSPSTSSIDSTPCRTAGDSNSRYPLPNFETNIVRSSCRYIRGRRGDCTLRYSHLIKCDSSRLHDRVRALLSYGSRRPKFGGSRQTQAADQEPDRPASAMERVPRVGNRLRADLAAPKRSQRRFGALIRRKVAGRRLVRWQAKSRLPWRMSSSPRPGEPKSVQPGLTRHREFRASLGRPSVCRTDYGHKPPYRSVGCRRAGDSRSSGHRTQQAGLKPAAWYDDTFCMDVEPDEAAAAHEEHDRRGVSRRRLTEPVQEDMRSGDRRRRPGLAGLLRDILHFGWPDESKH
jgi:hypothetical protein